MTTAKNGLQAVDLAAARRFDAVLMDLQMPEMDGLTATRKLREITPPSDLPIIAMTANAMAGDREQCMAAGMNDYIAKPIKPSILFETLIRWIRPGMDVTLLAGPPWSPNSLNELEKAENSADELPSLDGVDTRAGLRNMNGDRELYLKVLTNTLRRYGDIAQRIRAALDEKDPKAACRLVHTFKGVAGTMGAGVLWEKCQDLESALQNRLSDKTLDRMLSDFSTEALGVMTSLKILLPETEPLHAPRPGDPMEMDGLKPLLERLSGLVEEGDSDALEVMENIKNLLGPSEMADVFRELASQINDYEFEQARVTLRSLVRDLGMDE